MQSHLLAMVLLTSSQVRGVERPQPAPPPVRHIAAIHVRMGAEDRAVTLEMSAQAAQGGEEDDQPPALPVMPIRLTALEKDNFDRWLFAREPSERARQEHLKEVLDAKITRAASEHKLTESQRAKLRLAGRGDIKRFFDLVQKRRDDFEIERKDFRTGIAALRRLDELSSSYREGPFDSGSLFAKTLHKINTDRKAVR
jgi:hypothetical protein